MVFLLLFVYLFIRFDMNKNQTIVSLNMDNYLFFSLITKCFATFLDEYFAFYATFLDEYLAFYATFLDE